jgi:hypothetical protein
MSLNTPFLARGIIYKNGIWKRGVSWIRQEKSGGKLEKKRNEKIHSTTHTILLG